MKISLQKENFANLNRSSLKLKLLRWIFSFDLGPPNPENVPEDGKLKSEMMIKDNRRYYLDLKENTRGRFLRVRFFVLYKFFFSIVFIQLFLYLNLGISNHNTWRATITNRYSSSRYD